MCMRLLHLPGSNLNIVALELNDPICHSNECQIGSFSSEATICLYLVKLKGRI